MRFSFRREPKDLLDHLFLRYNAAAMITASAGKYRANGEGNDDSGISSAVDQGAAKVGLNDTDEYLTQHHGDRGEAVLEG